MSGLAVLGFARRHASATSVAPACLCRRAIVGLANAGKSTLLNVLADGSSVETAPTIGLDVKFVKKNNVSIKAWDLGGQKDFRSEWARYAADCQVILFVVDAAAPEQVPEARQELHRLLEHRPLADKPICVVANKMDLQQVLNEEELIKSLNLDYIMNPWIVIPASAKMNTNIDAVLQWLVEQAS